MRKKRYLQTIDNKTNYQALISSTLKEKYHYFFIGLLVLLGLVGIGSYMIMKSAGEISTVAVTSATSDSNSQNETATSGAGLESLEATSSSVIDEKPKVDPTAAAKAAEQTPSTDFKKYVVKAGDSLWKIAENAYSSGYNYKDLAAYNKISDPNSIEVGQVVLLPSIVPDLPTKPEVLARGGVGGPEGGTVSDVAAMTTPVVDASSSYVVNKGDTLWRISEKTLGDGFSWRQIAKANGIENQRDLKVGTTLVIPR